MGFDPMDALGVSRQALLLGALGGLALAALVAVVRNRKPRGRTVALGLDGEPPSRR